jgi:hypothetical protein
LHFGAPQSYTENHVCPLRAADAAERQSHIRHMKAV